MDINHAEVEKLSNYLLTAESYKKHIKTYREAAKKGDEKTMDLICFTS